METSTGTPVEKAAPISEREAQEVSQWLKAQEKPDSSHSFGKDLIGQGL